MTSSPAGDSERFLTFEVESSVYALPIAEVHEVAEASRICCVPTISRELVGVMNWHGDALPVVSTSLLLDGGEDVSVAEAQEGAAAQKSGEAGDCDIPDEPAGTVSVLGGAHVLVVSSRDNAPAQLGLPIDRVIGLVDGPRRRRGGGRLVVERRPVEGRVVSVLDPRRLVARATEVIERVS